MDFNSRILNILHNALICIWKYFDLNFLFFRFYIPFEQPNILFLKYILNIFAYLIAGENGLKFKALYGTYTKWPKNQMLYSLLKKNFSNIKFIKKMMGGSIIVSSIK